MFIPPVSQNYVREAWGVYAWCNYNFQDNCPGCLHTLISLHYFNFHLCFSEHPPVARWAPGSQASLQVSCGYPLVLLDVLSVLCLSYDTFPHCYASFLWLSFLVLREETKEKDDFSSFLAIVLSQSGTQLSWLLERSSLLGESKRDLMVPLLPIMAIPYPWQEFHRSPSSLVINHHYGKRKQPPWTASLLGANLQPIWPGGRVTRNSVVSTTCVPPTGWVGPGKTGDGGGGDLSLCVYIRHGIEGGREG